MLLIKSSEPLHNLVKSLLVQLLVVFWKVEPHLLLKFALRGRDLTNEPSLVFFLQITVD